MSDVVRLFYDPEGGDEEFQCFADDEGCEQPGNWRIQGGDHDGERVCDEHKYLVHDGQVQ